MSKIIRGIASKKDADRIAVAAKQQWHLNRGRRIPASKAHLYAGQRDMLTVEDPDAPGTFAIIDPYDAEGRRDTIEEIALHPNTPLSLKRRLAGHIEYTEAMADKLEPRLLQTEDDRAVPYTRSEEREAVSRIPVNTPPSEVRRVFAEKVLEVISERKQSGSWWDWLTSWFRRSS